MANRIRKLLIGGAAVSTGAYLTTWFFTGENPIPFGQVHAETIRRSDRRAKRSLPPRSDQISSLQTDAFDVLIIGGGATGAGCALDAVTRGK